MSACRAVQQSDEMFCAACRLRWDVNDPLPPDCLKSFPPVEREKVEELAAIIRNQMDLHQRKESLMAEMLRGCIAQLQSLDSRKRKEAINALVDLADMLEKKG